MLFAYVDETGDPGTPLGATPGSRDYTLGILLISDSNWSRALDAAVDFRRRLRSTFGIPMRAEIKAHYLVKNGGWFKGKGLSPKQRKYIFSQHLRLVEPMQADAFAVHVDKRTLMDPTVPQTGSRDPQERSWEALFQRLSLTYQRRSATPTPIHLSHDQGNDATIRLLARKARRYLMAGQAFSPSPVRLPSGWLIDDPVPRNSAESYFIQIADMVAWTASRTLISPGSSGRRVMPSWTSLGNGCYSVVNQLAVRRDPAVPPGIVIIK